MIVPPWSNRTPAPGAMEPPLIRPLLTMTGVPKLPATATVPVMVPVAALTSVPPLAPKSPPWISPALVRVPEAKIAVPLLVSVTPLVIE